MLPRPRTSSWISTRRRSPRCSPSPSPQRPPRRETSTPRSSIRTVYLQVSTSPVWWSTNVLYRCRGGDTAAQQQYSILMYNTKQYSQRLIYFLFTSKRAMLVSTRSRKQIIGQSTMSIGLVRSSLFMIFFPASSSTFLWSVGDIGTSNYTGTTTIASKWSKINLPRSDGTEHNPRFSLSGTVAPLLSLSTLQKKCRREKYFYSLFLPG